MQTFAAQVKTSTTELDVSITVTESSIQIDAGEDLLGRWSTKQCRFERLAPAAYELRLPDERVHVRVTDDHGFRSALALIRQEQGALVPRPLLWVGVVAIAGAIVASAVVGGESTAQAQPSEEPTPSTVASPTTVQSGMAPNVEAAPNPVREAASDLELVRRWNDLGAGTVLELQAVGINDLRDMTVTIADGTVVVDAAPTGTAENAESIMVALGMAIGSTDPEVAPSDRAGILSELGLRVNAPNVDSVHTSVEHGGVRYTLDYEPGERVHFTAGWEW
jgi:hypothetical protein